MIKSISGNISNIEELVNVIDNRMKMLAAKQKSMSINFTDFSVQQTKLEKKFAKQEKRIDLL